MGQRYQGDENAEEENGIDIQSGTHLDRNGRSECPSDPLQSHHTSDLEIRFHTKKELKEFQSRPHFCNICLKTAPPY